MLDISEKDYIFIPCFWLSTDGYGLSDQSFLAHLVVRESKRCGKQSLSVH